MISKNDSLSFFNRKAFIKSADERIIKLKEEDFKSINESGYWHAKDDPSTWIVVATVHRITVYYKNVLSRSQIVELAAKTLNTTNDRIEHSLNWNAHYMAFHDGDFVENTHVLPPNLNIILILCTGNSCRSQMAEGILKFFDKNLRVYSAGTHPADEVHPVAIQVMKEIGIDISQNHPKSLEQFLLENFDYVITVCDEAKEVCPVFPGVAQKLHFGFEDPAKASGSEEEVLNTFRKVRDEIYIKFKEFYLNNLKL